MECYYCHKEIQGDFLTFEGLHCAYHKKCHEEYLATYFEPEYTHSCNNDDQDLEELKQ
jgi:hypothetical protein